MRASTVVAILSALAWVTLSVALPLPAIKFERADERLIRRRPSPGGCYSCLRLFGIPTPPPTGTPPPRYSGLELIPLMDQPQRTTTPGSGSESPGTPLPAYSLQPERPLPGSMAPPPGTRPDSPVSVHFMPSASR